MTTPDPGMPRPNDPIPPGTPRPTGWAERLTTAAVAVVAVSVVAVTVGRMVGSAL